MGKEFIVSEKLLVAIIKYLQTSPYGEVAVIMENIQKLQPVDTKEKVIKTNKEK